MARFLEKTKDDIVGAAIVTKVMPKNNIELYIKRHWYYLKLIEIAKLGFRKYFMQLKDKTKSVREEGEFYSVRSVFELFKINYINVECDINRKEYVDTIRSKQPDVIVSSNPLFFKEELLNIPTKCCLNRHSALLPSYGGVWPVFWAVSNGEECVGVSIHTMEKAIDKGIILCQEKIKVDDFKTIFKLYEKCFAMSVNLLLEALNKVRNDDYSSCENNNVSSYYSFPTKEQWKKFRKRKYKFV